MKTKVKKKAQRAEEKSKSFDKGVFWIIGISIVLISFITHLKEFDDVPFYGDMGIISNATNLFTYYKLIFFALLTVFLGGTCLLRWRKYRNPIRWNFGQLFSAIILVGVTISFLFNPLGKMQFFGFFTRSYGYLAYLALYFFLILLSGLETREYHIKGIVRIVTTFCLVVTIIGLFQFFGMDIYNNSIVRAMMLPSNMSINSVANSKIATASFSIFTHYNYYSGFCSMLFPLVLSFFLWEREMKRKIALGITAGMLFLGVVTSVSQSGLYTMLFILLASAFFLGRKENWKAMSLLYGASMIISFFLAKHFQIQTYRELMPFIGKIFMNPLFYIGMVIAGVICGSGFWIVRKATLHRKKMLLQVSVILFVIGTLVLNAVIIVKIAPSHTHMFTDRGYAWTNTYQLLKENPVIGYGPDNFYYAFPQDRPEAKNYSNGQSFDKPHNMYLQSYMDAGLLGLIGFLGLLLSLMLYLGNHKAAFEDNQTGYFIRGLLLLIMAYMIQGIVNDNHLTVQPILFLILGVGFGLEHSNQGVMSE